MKKIILFIAIISISCHSFSQWGPFILDTITFEDPYEFLLIDSLPGNIWEVGVPQKAVFNSAFSLPNAIVTHTANTYPAGNHSRFILKIGEFNYEGYYPWDIFMEITHQYHTDTLLDGGYITVSYDNGQTWMNIIRDTVYEEVTPSWENENLYNENDTLYNGEFGFSGNSGGWITTWYSWHIIPVDHTWYPGDTMMIGFNFISDSLDTGRDGWMIDNIVLYAEDLGGSIGEKAQADWELFPNPAFDRISISSAFELQGARFRICNAAGQVAHSGVLNGNIIDVSGLQRGLYFLIIDGPRTGFAKKFFLR